MRIRDEYITLNECTYSIRNILPDKIINESRLVFLHDALGSIEQWKAFPEQLAITCQQNATIIERQGHGKSSPFTAARTKAYLHREALETLPTILRALDIASPILIGHSDGGSIALLYASKFETKSVISIAAHVFVEEITLCGIKKAVQDETQITEKLSKYHGTKTRQLFHNWWTTWLSDDFKDWNIEPALQKIKCPILVIQSLDDEYGTINQVKSILQAGTALNRFSFLPEEGGHAPHKKISEAVIAKISSFLSARF